MGKKREKHKDKERQREITRGSKGVERMRAEKKEEKKVDITVPTGAGVPVLSHSIVQMLVDQDKRTWSRFTE